jgi:hypothetical protein
MISSLTNTVFLSPFLSSPSSNRNNALTSVSYELIQLPSFCTQYRTRIPSSREVSEQPSGKVSGVFSSTIGMGMEFGDEDEDDEDDDDSDDDDQDCCDWGRVCG